MSSDDTKAKESKRKSLRYAVSDDCRLKASIKVRSADEGTAAKDWPGMIVDLSSEGAHIQISLGAVAYLGDSCVLTLSHSGLKTELRGSLAHYVCSTRYSVCGVRFDFSFAGSDKTYQPFFRAITASGGLVAGPAGTQSVGRHLEEYRGPDHARLQVWRDKPDGAIQAFDYAIARYGVALATVGTDMFKNKEHVRFRGLAAGGGDTGVALNRNQELDARWEFSLAGSNLPKTLAPDIRRLLRLVS
jgi:hypothetical protein